MIQIAQDISSRVQYKKRRRSGLRRGFLCCAIGEIDKSRCVTYFSTVPYCSQVRNALDCAFREKTYSLKCKNPFAWIFARYWNGVNSNLQIASVTVATGKIEDRMLLQKRKRRSMEWMQISDKDMKKSP